MSIENSWRNAYPITNGSYPRRKVMEKGYGLAGVSIFKYTFKIYTINTFNN